MARPKEPVNLLIAKGKKHLSQAEITQRQAAEVQPCTDEIRPPGYLTAKQKKRFHELAEQLMKLKILGETDVETLARYITAEDLYQQAVKDIRSAQKYRPASDSLEEMTLWAAMMDKFDKRQERYFKQAQTAAASLGLTISSRCRLVIPGQKETPKENKFSKFIKTAGGG